MKKKCPFCNNNFVSENKNRIYCQKTCANRAKAKRRYWRFPHGRTICLICKNEFKKKQKKQKYCSTRCSGESQRIFLNIPDCLENASRKIDKNIGYVRVYVPMHREANSWGYVYEHRVIAEQKIGRRLEKDEVVHHINAVRWDNRPENLEVMDKRKHSRLKRIKLP